jgi:hypothetical protein
MGWGGMGAAARPWFDILFELSFTIYLGDGGMATQDIWPKRNTFVPVVVLAIEMLNHS